MNRDRGRIPRLAVAVSGTALTAVLAGCGQQGGTAAAPPASTPPSTSSSTGTSSSSESPTTSSPTSPAAAQVPAPAPDNGLCKATDLSVSLGHGDGAAGTQYKPLKFTNTSGRTCVIQGFPGVSYVTGDNGNQVGAPAFRDGQKGPPITLKQGETASADVGFVNIQNYDPVACQPQPVRGIRVYPPQETASMFVSFETTGCGSDKIPGNQLTVKTLQKGGGD